MTNLMTDRMTSWIILWLIQMVKSGKFHTCNVFFKVLFLKHFAIHFRSAFARMKRRRYNFEIYENIDIVDWNQYHFFCLIDDFSLAAQPSGSHWPWRPDTILRISWIGLRSLTGCRGGQFQFKYKLCSFQNEDNWPNGFDRGLFKEESEWITITWMFKS